MANKSILMGNLTRDPDIRYTTGDNAMCVARYTLAVGRMKKDESDFISCVAFGKNGEFAEKYLRKGMKIYIEGRIQTGSYTNKDGVKVYTTDVVVEHHEFCEKANTQEVAQPTPSGEEFMDIGDIPDEQLPFQ